MLDPAKLWRGVVRVLVALWILSLAPPIANAESTDEQELAYTQTITDRADKLLVPLRLDNVEKKSRLRDIIVEQYRDLRRIHDARDAKLESAEGQPTNPALANAWEGVIRQRSDMELFRLHRSFLAKLSADLTPQQVEQVKDGLTYGVVPITHNRYLALLPDLSDEQKSTILAELLEAREYAMDAGSSEEKHRWFGEYKGRINNYLSAAGYDLRQAEKDLAERQATPGPGPSP